MRFPLTHKTYRMADGSVVEGYTVEDMAIRTTMRRIGMIRLIRTYPLVAAWVVEKYGEAGPTIEDIWAHEDEYEARQAKRPEIMCDCGHWEDAKLVMSTSRGTCCSYCYDRMSD